MSESDAQTYASSIWKKWSDPDHTEEKVSPYDYKTPTMRALKSGDPSEIRKAAVPFVQQKIVDLAMNAKSEDVQLRSSQFILAQEGQGAVTKVETTIAYNTMPPNQLVAIIMSRIAKLQKLIPGFSLDQTALSAHTAEPVQIQSPATIPAEIVPQGTIEPFHDEY